MTMTMKKFFRGIGKISMFIIDILVEAAMLVGAFFN